MSHKPTVFDDSLLNSFYSEALNVRLWILRVAGMVQDSFPAAKRNSNLIMERVTLACNYYFLELTNIDLVAPENRVSHMNEIYSTMVWRIKSKIDEGKGPTHEELVKMIAGLTPQTSGSIQHSTKIVFQISENSDPGYYDVSVGDLLFKLRKSLVNSMSSINDQVRLNFAFLLIRYYPLGISGSFFWSINRHMITEFLRLLTPQGIPFLECFASPFNHNIENYCSPFAEDSLYGSKGNFFSYMEDLKKAGTKKIFFIYNPPYTRDIVDRSAELIRDFIIENPECMLISMLPTLMKCDGIKILSQIPNSCSEIFARNTYLLYNFATGDYFGPPMEVTITVYPGSVMTGEEMMASVKKTIISQGLRLPSEDV